MLYIRRTNLIANIKTPISPPASCCFVRLANASNVNLYVYSADDVTDEHYYVIAPNQKDEISVFSKMLNLNTFPNYSPVFQLKLSQNGVVILTWAD